MGSQGKRVVIIGGGIGGGLAAKLLQFNGDVALIDPKDYFEISWANLRSMVEPSFAEKSVFKHNEYLSNGRLVVSHAVNITNTEVLVADGQLLPYDYLVVATGHEETYPKTRAARLNHYEAEHEKIKAANSILIVGGGPTGVELAGEIAADFPEKKVTLVHRGERLLEFVNPKASKSALDWLISKRVDVLLEQSVDINLISNEGKNTYKTSNGVSIVADIHFVCVGKPIGSWLRQTVLKDSLDSRGRLIVDENLKVKGRSNVFAIGDITNIPEIKQGYFAQKHAHTAAKNIKLLMNGGQGKMEVYRPKAKSVAIISLGRRDGVAQLPFMTVSGLVPGMMKSRDLFVGKTRKIMGQLTH
ncbi:hypothetical protein ACHQM5_019874 [Ranunculus cassubicifolius]